MKAAVADAPGASSVLRVRDVDDPVPGPGQVLVRVEAAGVNFADVVMRGGGTAQPFPLVPGVEGAGVVAAFGDDVEPIDGIERGSAVAWVPVLGAAAVGSYAELQVVTAAQLVPLPSDVSTSQAAAVLLQGLTAHYLAHDQYPVEEGTTVLVHAAAGGTGRLVVQWLKHLGARVIGTVSSAAKAEVATYAGADHVIRYTEADFVAETMQLTDGAGVDYVIDGVAGSTFRGDLAVVRPRGRVCVFGMAGGAPEPFSPLELLHRSITVSGGSMVQFLRDREEVRRKADDVWRGVREGWLRPEVSATLPLADAAEAHRRLEGRETTGKLVLAVAGAG